MTDVIERPDNLTERPAEPAGALAQRLVESATASLELFSIHLGRRLGLYDLLGQRPWTVSGLAERAGLAPRYAREWLEQQAVAGLVASADDGPGAERTFWLPEAHRTVLIDPIHPDHAAPLADMVAGIAGVLHRLPDAYRSGTGVPYADYGEAFRGGQGAVNRPTFTHDLPRWVRTVAERLAPPGRVADMGCGVGWSTIALAEVLPDAIIDGYDADPASLEAARRHAAKAGVADRVRFHLADAADPSLAGPYDLVLVFEALHDMARPVEALRQIRRVLSPQGVVLVGDERVAEEFTAPGDDVERLMYGWSVVHCLPAALAESPSAALGTVLRAATVHELARTAGYADCEELAVEHDFFRIYLLRRTR